MRILFLSAYPRLAGSQKVALQLAEGARRLGHRVCVGAFEPCDFLEAARRRGLDTLVIPARAGMLETGGAILRRGRLRQFREILTDYLPLNVATYRCIARLGCDLVYFAQERALLQAGPGARLGGARTLWHVQGGLSDGAPLLHRVAGMLADEVLCVSRAVGQDVGAHLTPRKRRRLAVVHNGLPDIVSAAPAARGDGAIELLFAGNVVPQRGVHVAVEAVARLAPPVRDRVRLSVAGWLVDEPYRRHLEGMLSRYGLTDRVNLLGYRKDIDALMAAADIVLCPPVRSDVITIEGRRRAIWWKEGFGLSALEAMRLAKPVIASRLYGLAEVVEDGATGLLVPPGDAGALAEAIARLAVNHSARADLGERGRLRYLDRFTEDRMLDSFFRFLDSVAFRAAGHRESGGGVEPARGTAP